MVFEKQHVKWVSKEKMSITNYPCHGCYLSCVISKRQSPFNDVDDDENDRLCVWWLKYGGWFSCDISGSMVL